MTKRAPLPLVLWKAGTSLFSLVHPPPCMQPDRQGERKERRRAFPLISFDFFFSLVFTSPFFLWRFFASYRDDISPGIVAIEKVVSGGNHDSVARLISCHPSKLNRPRNAKAVAHLPCLSYLPTNNVSKKQRRVEKDLRKKDLERKKASGQERKRREREGDRRRDDKARDKKKGRKNAGRQTGLYLSPCAPCIDP